MTPKLITKRRARDEGVAPTTERIAAGIARAVRGFADYVTYQLPYWPDPDAKCPAHGDRYCLACHQHAASCRHGGQCGYWEATGMHWDTCANRIRGWPSERPHGSEES